MSEKVIGIDLSVAARIVENAFRKELNMNDAEITGVSGDEKLEKFCLDDDLRAVRNCIRTNGHRGLPSLSPPRTILFDVIQGVGLGDTVAKLIIVVSDNAFFEVEAL